MTYLYLALVLGVLAVVSPARAATLPEPSYQECFELTKKAMHIEAGNTRMQHEAYVSQGIKAPVTAANDPQSPDRIDLLENIKQHGVTLKPDLNNLSATPQMEVEGVHVLGQPDEQEEANELSPYELKKEACEALYGIRF